MSEAHIYGLREKGASVFFYIGSTKNSPNKRFRQHLTKRTVNRHLSNKIKKIGKDCVELIIIEKVDLNQRFSAEYRWIQKYLSEGHPLTNKRLVPAAFEQTLVAGEKYEGNPAQFCYDMAMLIKGPGKAQFERNQRLLESLYRTAVKVFQSMVDDRWEETCAFLGIESYPAIQTYIKTIRPKLNAI